MARALAQEVAVALSFNGTTQAVMMATPADLTDFAYGFAASEGIARPEQILSVDVVQTPLGYDLQIWLETDAEAQLTARRRTIAGPVGCGLCGIDSLEQALRRPPPIPAQDFSLTHAQICAAIAALPRHQPLHDSTRAVHAAGFWADGCIQAVREDVGRHNALDKLIGHILRSPLRSGAVLLTSRVSIDMVQKVAALGAPMIIAVSAPTSEAVQMAHSAGITLIGLARPHGFETFTHVSRILQESDNVL